MKFRLNFAATCENAIAKAIIATQNSLAKFMFLGNDLAGLRL